MTGKVFERATIQWLEEWSESAAITHEFDGIAEDGLVRLDDATPVPSETTHCGASSSSLTVLASRLSSPVTTGESTAAAALAERRRVSEELHDEVGALQRELGEVSSLVRSLLTQWHASA